MSGNFYLGTSGFSYDEWKHGVFYPEGLKNREMLSYYSSQLSSVEINYTFRRYPTEKSLTTWREQAQPGFVFTLKANQRITHFKRLEDTDDDVRAFLEVAKTLGDRLGCVLFQCPPSLQYRRELIEAFVGYLPPPGAGVPRFAMEFRHPSWTEARELLLSQGIAWCVAETDDKDPGPDDLSWEPAGYLRLRKTEYSDDELTAWAGKIGAGPRRRRRRLLLLQARGRGRQSEDGETAARSAWSGLAPRQSATKSYSGSSTTTSNTPPLRGTSNGSDATCWYEKLPGSSFSISIGRHRLS